MHLDGDRVVRPKEKVALQLAVLSVRIKHWPASGFDN